MEQHEIKALALELMDAVCQRKIADFSLETDGVKIRIKTVSKPPMTPMLSSAPQAAPAVQGAISPQVVESESETQPSGEETIEGTRVESPIVGIFYAGPSPDDPPFVEVGQTVKKGDPLFIIEAMKTMNEIDAPCDGTITRIFAQNGDMVEYKQLLLVIS